MRLESVQRCATLEVYHNFQQKIVTWNSQCLITSSFGNDSVMTKLRRRSGEYTLPILSSFVLFNRTPWTSSVTKPATDVGTTLPEAGAATADVTTTLGDVTVTDGTDELRRNARLQICSLPHACAVSVKWSWTNKIVEVTNLLHTPDRAWSEKQHYLSIQSYQAMVRITNTEVERRRLAKHLS